MIKVGSDFSGVGAFNQALIRIGIDYEEIFACDMDKYARQTFCLNYGTENDLMLSKLDTLGKTTISAKDYSFYYPKNVYEREIPKESLDIFMTSPPCQSFSLAGKRKGEDSKNGVLFYNSHEFIQKNNPRYFIIENVKGLLSDDNGKTFQKWIDYLGGKSVNGNPVIFPHEESVPYHVYYQVMNAKHYGVPQNRERIFIIGIRDDADNDFSFPKPFNLTKRLKDVLESEVDEKYFLSDTMLTWIDKHREKRSSSGKYPFTEEDDYSGCITARYNKMGAEDIFIGAIRGRNPTDVVKVAKVGRSDEGKRLRKESLNRGKDYTPFQAKEITFEESDIMNCVTTATTKDNLIQTLEINENGTSNALTTVQKDNVVVIPANNSKGYDIAEEEEDSINFSNPNSETRRGRVGHGVSQTLDTACNQGILTKKMTKQQIEKFNDLEVDENIAGCITHAIGRMGSSDEYISSVKRNAIITQRIRRLTPTEAFRLMDFNQEMIDKTIESKLISDSQLYKQAGNSICVGVLAAIIEKINL